VEEREGLIAVEMHDRRDAQPETHRRASLQIEWRLKKKGLMHGGGDAMYLNSFDLNSLQTIDHKPLVANEGEPILQINKVNKVEGFFYLACY
jgi:hypothetical protein